MDHPPSSLSIPSDIMLSTLTFIHHVEPESSASGQKPLQDPKSTEAAVKAVASTIQTPSEASSAPKANSPPSHVLPGTPEASAAEHELQARTEPTPPKLRIAIIMTSLCFCVFVAAIDITIISTALPSISGALHSATGYQWIASSYVLGNTASTPSWGKISDIFGRKPVLLLAIVIFFVGSLICALAENIAILLAGRGIQGIGGSGLLTLVNIAISDLFSLRDRSLYYGLTSVVWAFAGGVGPILGGVFAQQLSWRWCFWINLPISGLVFIFLFFFMPQDSPGTPFKTGLKAVDWSGSLLIVGATLLLLLGLNFGGITFSWSSATVINLIIFAVFAVFLFGVNEWKLVKYPVIPLQLFHNRSAVGSFSLCFCHGFVMMGVAYYLPLYFQAVLGAGPLFSGVYLLPFLISNTLITAGTGLYIQKTGKYIPAVYLGLVLMVLGTGLLIDLDVDSNWPKVAMYQIILGAGIGMNFEGPLLALQASIDVHDVAAATSTISFTRTLSTAVSAIIGGVVFQNQMVKEAATLAILGPDVASQFRGGEATAHIDIIKTLPLDQQIIARGAFFRSLKTMWIVYLGFAVLALIAGLFISTYTLSIEHQSIQLGVLNRTRVDALHDEAVARELGATRRNTEPIITEESTT